MMRHFAAAFTLTIAATVCVSAQSAPKTENELIARVRQAFDHRSLEELRSLVYWGRSNPDAKTSFDRLAASDFHSKAGRVLTAPLAPSEQLEYTLNGVTYRPTLKPLGRVTIEFVAPGATPGAHSTSYMYGVREGGYYLLTAEPAR